MAIKSFHPPQHVLMGYGPSDVSPRVPEALSRSMRQTKGWLADWFIALKYNLFLAMTSRFAPTGIVRSCHSSSLQYPGIIKSQLSFIAIPNLTQGVSNREKQY
jgi:hypothetical protein